LGDRGFEVLSLFRYLLSNISITTQLLRGADRSYSGHKTAEFAHDSVQLTLIVDGALSVTNKFGAWTVPAGCAAWIPAGTRHSITPLPRARTRTLYLSNSPIRRQCAVLAITPLVRAIIDHVCDAPSAPNNAATHHLHAVLRDQLREHRELPLFVPALTSPLAVRVATALASDPAGTPRSGDLAAELGVSARTLERAFMADAGMPLGEWRQRVRISRAIALLAAGGSVQDIALEVGYSSPSAFVAVFKRYTGTTPGKLRF
jgi:AraC-like DNA-binding protein